MSIREFDVFCCSGYLDTCSLGVKNSWIFSLPCKEIWRTIDGFRLELIGTWSSGWGVASFTTTVGTRESADGLGEEDFIEDILRISLNFLYITIFQNSPKVFSFKNIKKYNCWILPKIREALFCGDQLTRRRWRRCLLREHSSDQKVIWNPKSAQSSTKAKGHRNQAVTIPTRIVYGIFGLFNGQHTFFQ